MALTLLIAWIAGQTRELNVFAAASLKESFQAIAVQFEARNPGVKVHMEFAGSQALAAQINQGAPADLLASAAEKDLDKVAYDPHSRRVFALNRMVLVSPATSAPFSSFRAMRGSKSIVLAAPAVPAGAYARQVLGKAAAQYGAVWRDAVLSHVVSEETDVRAVLTKVELGEADAGIVYQTDALAAGTKVKTVPIPESFQPRIEYPMAVLKTSPSARLAAQFESFVLGVQGRRVLTEHGFMPPGTAKR